MSETMENQNPTGPARNRLMVGIDLGTSRTAVMCNRGRKRAVRSVVGYPKDLIGVKLLGAPYVVGETAYQNRSYLDLRYPLEDGVLREYSERDIEVARHLLVHAIELAEPEEDDEVCAVIGVPARASVANRSTLLKVAQDLVDVALVVSEPFMVAYGQGKLVNSLVIDIGAGTVDICALKGQVPAPEDQATMSKAGNFIDDRLMGAIQERYPEVQMNANVACAIKEAYAFVGPPPGKIEVQLRAGGKPAMYDITDQVRVACEALLPDILENMENLIRGFPPEDQGEVLQNIVIAGGGSRIKGLDAMIAERMREYGEVSVTLVGDPLYDGCAGALKLALELPPKYWDQLGDIVGM